VILGVTGGIAAYKAAGLASTLTQAGVDVHVVMTEHASALVGPPTFQALTGHPVVRALFHLEAPGSGMPHIDLAAEGDLLLVAPATANFLGKLASGIADDALSTAALSFRGPVLVAPAMNSRLWEHPAVQRNAQALKDFGVEFLGPETGHLACEEEGVGRMAEPEAIVARVLELLGLARRDPSPGSP